MFDLGKPLCANVFERWRTHHTEADEEHVRLPIKHDNVFFIIKKPNLDKFLVDVLYAKLLNFPICRKSK